ncbi:MULTISPECIES: HI0074 family nucleotidyltransferase substrate-binding subunit [Bacillaceae]|uniref:Nucleotidyltransferase substrate binding protein n=1 Tax=Evansella alkalicola TaxID=745819 RepID=A0ABS6JZ37_9BACI|nr:MULTISPECIES: HI0074 family nucleotidyltransferase substrate-binding subunit [Bacillaceae]MBU9723844.1 nucleotidyltransferase substrate binding protein [Bacillus alkalicola]
MGRLQERLNAAERALMAFQELVQIEKPNDVERDASIQRFEFTYEACWKSAKQYLYDIEGIDVASPKGVIRKSREVSLFDEHETILALQMVNDRNLTVHTYNEEVAVKIHSSLNQYYSLLDKWVERMRETVNE